MEKKDGTEIYTNDTSGYAEKHIKNPQKSAVSEKSYGQN